MTGLCSSSLLFIFLLGLSIGSSEGGHDSDSEDEFIKFVGEKIYHVPFKTRISEPFKDGQTIHAVGKITENPKRIDLNFHKVASPEDEFPLHLSVRFDEGLISGQIVFNTYEKGNWSLVEERVSSPYTAGEDFDIRVRIKDGQFIVFGNRREVSIIGDLEVLRVFHYGGTNFPSPYNAIARLFPGKRLDISAIPLGNRANINLYRSGQKYALHLSIRFNEGAIVRNAMIDRNWGVEERDGGFPLARNELFDLTIVNAESSFEIYINTKKFASFAHRMPNNDIETLEIDGSIDLLTVTIT